MNATTRDGPRDAARQPVKAFGGPSDPHGPAAGWLCAWPRPLAVAIACAGFVMLGARPVVWVLVGLACFFAGSYAFDKAQR